MTYISIVRCDAPDCDDQIDLNEDKLHPTYTRLLLGGSDFEMSSGQQTFDFCGLGCLISWLKSLEE